MSGLTLYKATELAAMENFTNAETGEIDIDGLEAANIAVAEKRLAVVAFIKNRAAEIAAIENAAKELADRAYRLSKANDGLIGYLAANMRAAGVSEIKAHDGTFSAKLHIGRDAGIEIDEGAVFDYSLCAVKGIADFDTHDCGEMSFDDALNAAAKANKDRVKGYDDWVLPETQILRALAILDSSTDVFWSSSPYMGYSNNAWVVYFGHGFVGYCVRRDNFLVRLVRASQCVDICIAGALKSMSDAGIPVSMRPSKTKIREAIERGEAVAGARIVRKDRLEIK